MTTELLTFRADTMSVAWRLAGNWCRQHGRLAVSVRLDRTRNIPYKGVHRRILVESIPSAECAIFAQWAADDAKARKSRGVPIVAKAVMVARDKAMTEATKHDEQTRRDFEIAMRSLYDGQDGPWHDMPWMGDGMLRGVNTAPAKAVEVK